MFFWIAIAADTIVLFLWFTYAIITIGMVGFVAGAVTSSIAFFVGCVLLYWLTIKYLQPALYILFSKIGGGQTESAYIKHEDLSLFAL